ncbi:MAG: hypothetical protein SFW63_00525 [Alphaproteobacteria bacterium]|nr:hypothetical protein [Alphaproteobacteria bacterium]
MSESLGTDELLTQIAAYITESRELLERGDVVELSDLDGRIARLCEASLALSAEEKRRHAAALEQLLDDLTQLGNLLQEKRGLVMHEMKASGAHRKAASAYRMAERPPADGKES